MPSGEKTGKLTVEEVAQFKAEMYSDSLVNLAKKYTKVTPGALKMIRNGETWRNVDPASN